MTDETNQPSGQTNQPPSPPWGMYVVLTALALVSIGAIVVLLFYREVFTNATDVTTVLGSWFTVVGTIVGAYFGIKASGDAADRAQGALETANNTANQALGALNPADASNIVSPPPGSPPPTAQ